MVRHWQELIILILSLIFGGLVSSLFLNLIGANLDSESTSSTLYLANAVITQVLMFMGAAFLFFKITKIDVRSYIRVSVLSNKDWLFIALSFVAAICIVLAINPLTTIIESTYAEHSWVQYQHSITEIQNKVIGDLRGWKMIIALATLALLPAVAEEIVFRGILYKIFKDLLNGKQLAMFLSALVFSIFHFQVLSFLPILILGYLLAALYEKTHNLATAVLLHFAFNAVQIIFWQA